MDVLESIILAYPQKGHTHGPLDATFGQCCVKIANEQFDSANHVVQILQTFLDNAIMESGASQNKVAYKLDESPSWEAWWDELHLQMANLTGPDAPHWFHICNRRDLDLQARDAPETAWPGAPQPQPGDIVCAVKDRMASPRAHQVALLVPSSEVERHRQSLSVQPQGLHPRRPVRKDDAKKLIASSTSAFHDGLITLEAHGFLVGWATGTTVKERRPSTYTFLTHRCSDPNLRPAWPVAQYHHPAHREPRQIQILRSDGAPLPFPDDGEEAAVDQLVLVDEPAC